MNDLALPLPPHQLENAIKVVHQMAVDLFAKLGNWLADVSSPYEKTSSVRSSNELPMPYTIYSFGIRLSPLFYA
ncbi:hypothetical protein CSKR_110047 [Clonorchis sinensis]|uniref:Uncharacterized protein n=1 Tax=Clonorchis sinensis TaxID=79923 RepID=A0A419Q2Z4_CLOSI|nr:hypothetical protein CSKR_110047 [Clonorchis sinensis]